MLKMLNNPNKYILIVTRGYGKHGIFENDQAFALSKAGCKVIYVAVDLRSLRRWRKWGVEHFFRDGIEIYAINIPLGRVPHSILSYFGKMGLKYLYKRIKNDHGEPSVVHAHFLSMAEIALVLKPLVSCLFVMTEHSSALIQKNTDKWIIKQAKQIYHSYDSVIAVSEFLKNCINTKYDANAIVIPNMLDTIFLTSNAIKFERHNGFSFIFVGNMISGKRPLECINTFYKAFKDIFFIGKNGDPIKLKMIGDGPLRKQCDLLIKRLDLQNHVEMKGRLARAEIAGEFAKSDCFVLPSAAETFGVVYIEAMACGLPVIATRCGGPETIVNGSNGILVDIDKEDALIDAYIYMYHNLDKYSSVQIMQYAKKNYSLENITGKIIKIYKGSMMNEDKN